MPDTSSSTDTTIRSARPTDRESIIEVAHASGLFQLEEMSEIRTTLDAFFSSANEHDQWLISDSGQGANAIAYYAPERMTNGTWNLYLLAVRTARQGHGSALVNHVEEDLRTRGARVLLIETSGVAEFAGQRAFYTRLGYREEARIQDFYDSGDDKIVYWKSLATLDELTEVVVSPVHRHHDAQ